MPTTTTTTLKNISGKTLTFSFIPLHGKELAPNEEVTIDGDIYTFLASNARKLKAFQDAINNNLIELIGTPTNPAAGEQYRPPVQNIPQLRAVPAADRADKDVRLVEDDKAFYRFDLQGVGADDGDNVILPTDGGPGRWFKSTGGAGRIIELAFTPTSGQTVFPLTEVYDTGEFALVTVNGIGQDQVVNFTIVGSTLTWLDVPFVLSPTDSLCVRYKTIQP